MFSIPTKYTADIVVRECNYAFVNIVGRQFRTKTESCYGDERLEVNVSIKGILSVQSSLICGS